MSKKEGSVFGGILLIAGSCIGAGMLGLPIQTGLSGFFPSLGLFFCACLFMTVTALILVEVSSWFPSRVNLLTMSAKTIGPIGKHLCWVTYLFLFYSLLVAYISGSGHLFQTILYNTFSYAVPIWPCSLLFVLLFGWVVYLGTRHVD
jgi:tyrosine-specific transport protein